MSTRMRELVVAKNLLDTYQLRSLKSEEGLLVYSMHAPWIARQDFLWPHHEISLGAFEAEADAIKAAVTEAWSKNQDRKARDHLAKLFDRCKEINKARILLDLLPITVLWDGRQNPVVEIFIDWEFMQDHRSSTDLHCKPSKYSIANIDAEEAKMRLKMAHAHVALHLLRADLYEAWYRKPVVGNVARHTESAECLSCRGPLNSASGQSFFADKDGLEDNEVEGSELMALPPYKEG